MMIRYSLQQKAADDEMSVRETEKFVQKFNKIKDMPEEIKPEKVPVPPEIIEAQNTMSSALETKVKIVGDEEKGKITIDYYSSEQLDILFEHLSKKI